MQNAYKRTHTHMPDHTAYKLNYVGYLIGLGIGLWLHSKNCWVVLTQFWVKYGKNSNIGLTCHLKM